MNFVRARSFRPLRRMGFAALAAVCLLPILSDSAHAQGRRGGPNPFVAPAATVHAPRVREYHVRHMKVYFTVNAAEHSATGIVTHYLTPLRGPLSSLQMDARASLVIDSCSLDGKDAQFEHKDNVLTVYSKDAPLPNGKEVALEIHYRMSPPGSDRARTGANGAGGFTWIDATPNDPERRPQFWTQGETNTNSAWVPCYDFPNDKCTSETHTTVPEDWIVIGNGTESPATHDEAAHTRTYNWTMSQPHSTYLLSLVGGELDVQKEMWRGVPLYYVVPKGKASLIPGSFGNTPDMLSWFSDKLGVKYAWPKYAQCAVYNFPGGMENVSATTLGANGLTDRRTGNYPMSSLNSHELAHQWFGDLVTCSDWGDAWLNESFATFFEMYYMEHLDGEDAYQREVENNTQSYLRQVARTRHALSTNFYRGPDDMFDQGHTYAKGGVILHTLRRQLGDKAFFGGMGFYLKQNAYKPVDTNDLVAALSTYTHKDIKPFFDQWVRKPGHPVLNLTWTYDDARKEVVASVQQTQDTSDGTPIYTTPLTIGLLPATTDSAGGSGSRGAIMRERVTLSQVTQEFRIPAAQKPALVLLDPDHDMLREIKDTAWKPEDLPVLVLHAPNAVDRRRAAGLMKGEIDPKADTTPPEFDFNRVGDPGYRQEFQRQTMAAQRAAEGTPGKTLIALFSQAIEKEPSDSVAAYMMDRLSVAKDPSLRPLFHAQAQSKHMARRESALNALGMLPATDEDTRLLRAAALSDTAEYGVVEAGLNGLARQDASANMDVFQHQIAQPSFNDQLAATSVEALGQTKSDMAVPALLTATGASHTPAVRAQAARAIGTLAPGSKPVHDTLVALLDDASPRVEQAAIETLTARMDRDAVPALITLSTTAKAANIQKAARDAAGKIEAKQ